MCSVRSLESRSRFSLLHLCLLLVSLVLLPDPGSASVRGTLNFPLIADSGTSPGSAPAPATYVYVGAYTEGSNKGDLDTYISGFAVAGNGSAQKVPGSPFQGPSFDMVGNPKFLFASDGHNLVTYTRGADGSLKQTFSVNGTQYDPCQKYVYDRAGLRRCDDGPAGLSLDLTGQTLYVFENFYDGSDNAYLSWKIAPDGSLSYVPDQTDNPVWATAGGWPLSFATNDRYAYTTSVCKWDGNVWGLLRNPETGSVTYFNSGAAPPPPLLAGGYVGCSDALAVSSTGFVTVLWDGAYCCGCNGVLQATYTINKDGTLGLVPNSAFVPTVTECEGWNCRDMAFDPSGRYLAISGAVYTSDYPPYTSYSAIQTYQLQADGTLAAIGPPRRWEPSTVYFSSVAWDNANHLYALSTQCERSSYYNCASFLYIFNATEGTLTPAPGSPHPVGPGSATDLVIIPGS